MTTGKGISASVIFLLLLCSGLSFNCASPIPVDKVEKDVLTLAAKIPLPNIRGRIDHLAYDSINHLVFVAALGNNTVEVVDIHDKKVVHTITGLHAPQGVVYIPLLHRLVVANDDGGTVMFFDVQTYKLLNIIDLKDDADNMRYDEASGLLYVGYGSGGIAIVNAATMKQTANIPLDGHPESFQIDKKRNKLYINVPDADEVEVAGLLSNSIITKWKDTKASSNFPMALDEMKGVLYIGCRNPGTLWMKNVETGNDIAFVPCSGDADDVFYSDNLVYLSAGKGYIDIFKSSNQNECELINYIITRNGARTSLLVEKNKELLLAIPARGSSGAELWVYEFNADK